MKVVIFILLLMGFLLLFYRLKQLAFLNFVFQRTKEGIAYASRNRLLENRISLGKLREQEKFWYRLERELNYSGLKRRFPFLNAEWYLTLEVVFFSLGTVGALFFVRPMLVPAGWLVMWVLKWLLLSLCRMNEQKKVNDNLLELLDFLGNYSVTKGELTGVFLQVSKFMDEPLKSALEQCCYEAQTTGDVSAAMLVMAEKIEHPKFKELVQNLEIAGRYCTDLTILVNSSRKSMRDYLRMQRERKGMLREAGINMGLLLLLSVFSMATVDRLISVGVWTILFTTWPGKLALFVIVTIFLLFGKQVMDMNK